MKKKFLICLAMLVCILGLTACGKEMTRNSFTTSDEAKEAAEGLCQDLGNMQGEAVSRGITMTAYAEEYSEYTKSSQFEQTVQMLGLTMEDVQGGVTAHVEGARGLGNIEEEFGNFVSILSDETEVTLTEDKADVRVKIQGDKVYKGNKERTATVEVTITEEGYGNVTVSANYDMSELMTNAALNTLLGMGTVFLVLILIYALISCFKFIPSIQEKCGKIGQKIRKFFGKFRKRSNQETSDSVPEPVKITPQAAAVEETDDTELIAVIAAAIAASEGAASADGYVVRSIIRR